MHETKENIKTINMRNIMHRKQKRIALYFHFNKDLIEIIKQIPGRRWSKTKKCWHVPFDTDFLEIQKSFPIVKFQKTEKDNAVLKAKIIIDKENNKIEVLLNKPELIHTELINKVHLI